MKTRTLAYISMRRRSVLPVKETALSKFKRESSFSFGMFLVAILGFVSAAYFLNGALIPLVLAWLLAYLLQPLVGWLQKKRLSPFQALWVVYLGTLLLILGVFFVVVPRLIFESVLFVQYLPFVLRDAANQAQTMILSFNIPGLEEAHLRELLQKQISSLSFDTVSWLSIMMNRFGTEIVKLAVSIANYALFPIFYYYMLAHFGRLRSFFLSWIPDVWRVRASQVMDVMDQVISGYVRGQITVCSILAVGYAIGLSVVGLKYGAIIGIVTGLLNIVPYFGFSIGVVSGLLVALFSGHGLPHVLSVGAVFLVIQMTESFFLTPRIVGRHVGIDPFLAMLALIIGGNCLGLFGMIIAVPVAAFLKVGYDKWMKTAAI